MNKTEFSSIDTLILSYLEGRATGDEILMLEAWMGESDENRRYFRQFKNIWEATVALPISTNKALAKVLKQINPKQKSLTFWQFAQRIAAVLFIPALITVIWMYSQKEIKSSGPAIAYNTAVAAFGTFSQLELPDGSRVWLNAGSSLKYPDKFDNNNRVVQLCGEAYFEVSSNESIPFIVNTPYFSVKATGTRFNIRAEKNFHTASVTLVEGKVAVQKLSPYEPAELIASLKPDQHMLFDTLTSQYSIQTEDSYKHFAWKDGKLVFRNDNISEVARRISLQYNVDIEILGDAIKRYRYRATFENEPLGELLRLLKISSPIDYREVKPIALPDGTFSRRKIIIFSAEKRS